MDKKERESEESWLLFKEQYPPRPLPRELQKNPYAVSRGRTPFYWALGAALAAWFLIMRPSVPVAPRSQAQDARGESPLPFSGSEPGLAAAPRFSEGLSGLDCAPRPGLWRAENQDKILRFLPRGVPAEPVALESVLKSPAGLDFPPFMEPARSGSNDSRREMMTRRRYAQENVVGYAGVVRGTDRGVGS